MNRWTPSANLENAAALTTDELISAVLDGRTAAYAEIVCRYQQSVLRVVNAMLYDRSATEDVVQQVFVNAYQHLDRFELGRDFGNWIRMIARNVVREELRRASRYDARLKSYAEVLLVRWSDDQRAEEYEQDSTALLDECLKKLASRAAEVVRLRYQEGWNCERIAEALDTSCGAVRNVLSRARTQLRECIHQGRAPE